MQLLDDFAAIHCYRKKFFCPCFCSLRSPYSCNERSERSGIGFGKKQRSMNSLNQFALIIISISEAGSGIIHQVILKITLIGGMMIGTDSHTPAWRAWV